MRFRNSAVDSSGSSPWRSAVTDVQKNAPGAAPLPTTTRLPSARGRCRRRARPSRPGPGRRPTGPRRGCRTGGSDRAATGSTIERLSQMITAMTMAWKTNAARQLIAVVMRPPMSGPGGGADASHARDHAEGPGARGDVGEEQRREDVDGRDQQRRCRHLRGSSCRGSGRRDRATRRSATRRSRRPTRPMVKHRLRPHRSVSLPPGIMKRRHHEQEDRDRDLHALHGRVEVLADVGDHHVHVRAREAADELREGERDEDLPQRRPVLFAAAHVAPASMRRSAASISAR